MKLEIYVFYYLKDSLRYNNNMRLENRAGRVLYARQHYR